MAIIEATDKNITSLLQADYTVVDFYGDHCGPCKMFAPIYHEASNDLPLIQFVKANIEAYPELSDRFGIRAVPTVRFYRNGEQLYEQLGAVDRETLDSHIARLLYD